MTPAAQREDRFNLSAAALRFPQLTLFFLLVVAIAGTLAYLNLGQREDPDFTFRSMVVRTIESCNLRYDPRLESLAPLQEMVNLDAAAANR